MPRDPFERLYLLTCAVEDAASRQDLTDLAATLESRAKALAAVMALPGQTDPEAIARIVEAENRALTALVSARSDLVGHIETGRRQAKGVKSYRASRGS